MKHIKRVPFEKLGNYLDGTRQVAVEKDGKVVGHYIPRIKTPASACNGALDLSNVRPESRESVLQLRDLWQEIYERAGMTEDEFADFMDPTLGCICEECTETEKS